MALVDIDQIIIPDDLVEVCEAWRKPLWDYQQADLLKAAGVEVEFCDFDWETLSHLTVPDFNVNEEQFIAFVRSLQASRN